MRMNTFRLFSRTSAWRFIEWTLLLRGIH